MPPVRIPVDNFSIPVERKKYKKRKEPVEKNLTPEDIIYLRDLIFSRLNKPNSDRDHLLFTKLGEILDRLEDEEN